MNKYSDYNYKGYLRRISAYALLASVLLLACTQTDTMEGADSTTEALESWQDLKFGMFIHWGVYSIPAGVWKGEQIEKLGEQIQRHARISDEDYKELASQFNPVNFDAEKIVQLAKSCGMKYIVFTSKHHDGFCMFESEETDFNIVDFTSYKKDIVGELAEACKKHGLKLGLYYSTPDWHFNGPNPEINPADGKISVFSKVSKENEDYQVAQLKELLTKYGDILELFFDMGEPTAEQSKRFEQTVHGLQPNCLINGRIMNNQGDFITMPDNHVPDVPLAEVAWESPGTFYHTWGYKSWVKGKPLPEQVKNQVRKLVRINARGGNFLLNIGPKSDGTVQLYEQKVLEEMGKWVSRNSEAIYNTAPTPFKKLSWGECTQGVNKLYFHVYDWPEDGKLIIPGLTSRVKRSYLTGDEAIHIPFESRGDDVILDISKLTEDENLTVLTLEYEGELKIIDPFVRAEPDQSLMIGQDDWIHHGKYGKESYRSILKDYYRSCDIEIPEKGEYLVELEYRMKTPEKDFKLEIGGKDLLFTLKGKQQMTRLESLYIDKGIHTLYIRQGRDFEFKTTVEEFNLQDRTYRTMNIDLLKVKLVPVNNAAE